MFYMFCFVIDIGFVRINPNNELLEVNREKPATKMLETTTYTYKQPTKQKNTNNGTIYLLVGFEMGPPCHASRSCLSIRLDGVELDSTHKRFS